MKKTKEWLEFFAIHIVFFPILPFAILYGVDCLIKYLHEKHVTTLIEPRN
jgi:hypothetical protein